MPRALITGITGQTGSYLCEQLLADGWEVHGIVRVPDDAESALHERSPGAQLHAGDLADAAQLCDTARALEPDAIFNLGGISSVAHSWNAPEETGRVTGVAVAALLDSAWRLRNDTGRRVSFVQASSAEIFGFATEVPQNEQTRIQPSSPYGAAKAYAHHMVGLYRQRGLEATSCILYNHESPRRPVEFVTRKITSGVARIALGLEDFLTLGNLDARRDWGWAPDYARALHLAAIGEPGDYVIATGQAHTVREFVELAFAAAGIVDWERHIRQDPAFMRPSDAPELVGDSTRAREVLGWQPSHDLAGVVAGMVAHDMAVLSSAA